MPGLDAAGMVRPVLRCVGAPRHTCRCAVLAASRFGVIPWLPSSNWIPITTLSSSSATPPSGDRASGEAPSVRSPLEGHSSYRAEDWSPQRVMFHQNLETFADRVGLLVGLQSNGKLTQEEAYAEIRRMWKQLKESKGSLLND